MGRLPGHITELELLARQHSNDVVEGDRESPREGHQVTLLKTRNVCLSGAEEGREGRHHADACSLGADEEEVDQRGAAKHSGRQQAMARVLGSLPCT